MFSKNNTKMNNKKQYEKVNHYGIKKFNAGTASVLIASAFMFLGGAAQAADTNKQETTVAVSEKAAAIATEEKVEATKVETPAVEPKTAEVKEVAPKAEVKEETTIKAATKEEKAEETKAEKATAKEVNKNALQAKISQLDNLFVSLAGQELSEEKQAQTVSAAVELNKAKDLAASASVTQEQVDAQVASLEAAINNLNKVEKTADKKEETKKEEKSETTVAKENLEKAVSEAKAVNQAATTFATKEVKEEAPKAEIKAMIETSEKEIAKALDIFNSDSSTKEDVDQQRKELEKAIEAVYVTMQRAGHRGKVESILEDATGKAQTITGKGVVREGKAVVNVQNAYISMNDKNTAPKAWGIDVMFDTSKAEKGDTTTIELHNLADFGAAFKKDTPITAEDGTVIGKVKSIAWKNSTGNKGTTTPYFAQRMKDNMTYEQRLAEQPAIANETGTVTYTIEWNEKAKNYAVTTYSASNLTGSGYLAPDISKDTPYTATIKVDGQTIVEHTYTHLATKPNTSKSGTMASLLTGNGIGYKGAERISKNDSVLLQSDDDISYGKGSTFTLTLPSDEFTYFRELEGGTKTITEKNATYRPSNRWTNVKANENNVWILNDGRDSHFKLKATLKSPTELVLEVVDGEIEPGSTVAVSLANLGIEKVLTDYTLTDEYSKIVYNELGHVKDGSTIGNNDKTAATLTVTGGKSVNGQPENVTSKVANGWVVSSSTADANTVETGAVTLTLTDLETGKVIGYMPTEYNGKAEIQEDGTYNTKNVLGKKYDVTGQVPELIKHINETDYVLVNLPPKGPAGTINVSEKRIRDIMTAEEITKLGLNPNAYVNNVIYSYIKKTKVEEVSRTIKFVYADNVANLAGQDVFPAEKQTVSYTGTVKLSADGKAEVDENKKPIYTNWKGNGDTTLPEVKVPQKEGFVASLELVPVQKTTATDEDYEVVVKYSAIQKAKTTFVDEKGNAIPGVDAITEEGGSETPLTKANEIRAKITELEDKGYELIDNGYPTTGNFDNDSTKDQEFIVTVKERVVPVTPDKPKTPGTPVDGDSRTPGEPEGPKYPAGLEEKDLNKTVTRTITYVYADGTPVLGDNDTPRTETQQVKFTRTAKVNLVTKEVTYGDWTEKQELSEVKSPVIAKHIADRAKVDAVEVDNTSKDIAEVVTYTPLGSWVPNIPGQTTTPIAYPNDKDNPTKPGTDKPVVPYVPGFTPKDRNGQPLKPVDPTDPTKGYEVPSIPTDPSQDIPINYVSDIQKATTKFVYLDQDGKEKTVEGNTPIVEEGKSNNPLTKANEIRAKITELENQGYELINNEYPTTGNFDSDSTKDQEFTVTVKERVVPVTPDKPKTPGTPVDGDSKTPGTPEGPKYPAGLEEKDLNKTVTRTITYVYADGTPVLNEDGTPKTVTQEVKFTRTAKVNLVTGKVVYGNSSAEQTLEEVKSPAVKGYLADRAIVPTTKVTSDSENAIEVVTYKPLGSWIPNIPGQPTSPIKYPNDPQDPTKPGQPTEVLPYVPGFTPEDKDGNPLKPVDPTDPTKGYVVPNIPTDPSEDTVINYVANKANLVVKYVDEKGKDLRPAETTEGKVGDEYTTTGKVIPGHLLVRVEGEAKGKIGKDGSTVTYVYKPLGSWIPNIPGQPTSPIKYPNDPQDPTKPGQPTEVLPYVPGYTPQDENGNPLKLVDPQGPTKGYIVPDVPANLGQDTPINYVANPKPQPNQDQNSQSKPAVTPEKLGQNNAPVQPKANGQVKRLANTGTTETNTGLAGLGLATLAGLLTAAKRRKEK